MIIFTTFEQFTGLKTHCKHIRTDMLQSDVMIWHLAQNTFLNAVGIEIRIDHCASSCTLSMLRPFKDDVSQHIRLTYAESHAKPWTRCERSSWSSIQHTTWRRSRISLEIILQTSSNMTTSLVLIRNYYYYYYYYSSSSYYYYYLLLLLLLLLLTTTSIQY